MYSRYIPPGKGSKVSQKAEAEPEPEPEQRAAATASPATVGDAGFTYSRYVPGSKSATRSVGNGIVRFHDADESPPAKRKLDSLEETVESTPVERKKSKKERNSSKLSSEQGDAPVDSRSKKTKLKKDKATRENRKDEANATGVDHELEASETGHTDTSARDKKEKVRSKKSRKEKATHRLSDAEDSPRAAKLDDSPDDVTSDRAEDMHVDLGEGLTEVKEHKTRKEKKKRNSLNGLTPEEEELSENENDSRHKAVMERKTKALKLAGDTTPVADAPENGTEPIKQYGLEPLPQPEQAVPNTAKPSYETLPPWLAAPTRVPQAARKPFTELGLLPKAARVLEERGYKDAFAVQTAAIPFLLPSSKHNAGDLLISAATGSGKTLAYALPIVRDMSQGHITRLRALVVLPTRELVKQAQDVFELCAKAYEGSDRKRVRIGIAVGNQSLKYEQQTLMTSESRYDPETYKAIEESISPLPGYTAQETDPILGSWDGEVVDFMSKVDVLLCTPGRLVEHLDQTTGFSLDYVRWLVVDEADKLLAQSFQGWLDVVMERFQVNKFSARDFPDMNLTGVRKVVLSATLTRDLSLLNQLSLRRPRLIVLEGGDDVHIAEHSLPETLKEFAVRVHDVNLKPLYLLELLNGQHMRTPQQQTEDSDSSSDSDSDSSKLDSDSESTSSSESASSNTSPTTRSANALPVSLIFTKSNESALRLSRLLTILDKSLSAQIDTLTSTTPSHTRRKTLRAFTTPSSPVRLIIASDLVARGIDLPKLDHVINYDLPPSVAGYVHRVGRTARAGRVGSAWTLVGDEESGWFWGKIAKGAGVRRALKVERVRIEEMTDQRVQEYESALKDLGKEALNLRRRK